jgi:vacuolar-type H+-ATPase subunit F/Vma7
MNNFYNKEQKNNKIFDEIKLTQEQINVLKIKDHVLQYIKDNVNNEEENIKDNNDNNNNAFMNMNNASVKNEGFTSDLFNGLNLNFNMDSNNNVNEQNDNGDDMGGYTGFQLMGDDDKDKNNSKKNEDDDVANKIKELNEKIQNAVDVS